MSIIKKENVSLLNVAYDMDRVVVVLGENKVKEAIEVAFWNGKEIESYLIFIPAYLVTVQTLAKSSKHKGLGN